MDQSLPPCPRCKSAFTYEDRDNLVCPECAHEWPAAEGAGDANRDADDASARVVRDANGTVLQDGDSVILAKDLKVKGAPLPLKAGTKVKKIRLVDGDHDIDCYIDGFGAMALKSQFVKKA